MKNEVVSCSDLILGFHITVLLAFAHFRRELLHASGKFVPALMEALSRFVPEEDLMSLRKLQQVASRLLQAQRSQNPDNVDISSEEVSSSMSLMHELAAKFSEVPAGMKAK